MFLRIRFHRLTEEKTGKEDVQKQIQRIEVLHGNHVGWQDNENYLH